MTPEKDDPVVRVSVCEPRLTTPRPDRLNRRTNEAPVVCADIERRDTGACKTDESGTGDRASPLQRQRGPAVDFRASAV